MAHPEHPPAPSDAPAPDRDPDSDPDRRPLAPDTGRLSARAARAWTEPMAVDPIDGGHYTVESDSGKTYVVDLPRGDCTCPDHEIRDERCKHLRRVAIEVTERRVPPPGYRGERCSCCRRRAFLPESGPPLCSDCSLERGDVAVDRETGDTVVVRRTTATSATEYYIETAGCTVAEYSLNNGYPPEDPVVEVVYPFVGDPRANVDDLRSYAFPRSRLSVRDAAIVE